MYSQYLKERQGVETVRRDHGFATYKQLDDDTFYIVDIFVEKDHRRNRIASELSNDIMSIAFSKGAKRLLGSVDITTNGVTQSLKAVLGDGFEYSHASGNVLYFVKQI